MGNRYSFKASYDTKAKARACTECGRTTTAKQRMRVDPRNYHVDYRRLCEPCAKTLGYGSQDLISRQLAPYT